MLTTIFLVVAWIMGLLIVVSIIMGLIWLMNKKDDKNEVKGENE